MLAISCRKTSVLYKWLESNGCIHDHLHADILLHMDYTLFHQDARNRFHHSNNNEKDRQWPIHLWNNHEFLPTCIFVPDHQVSWTVAVMPWKNDRGAFAYFSSSIQSYMLLSRNKLSRISAELSIFNGVKDNVQILPRYFLIG